MQQDKSIDNGKGFDWGRTSEDYAKYRDIYPEEFYQYILKLGLCKDGQKVLDIGTGTGVLPRNMYKYGAKWTGTDIADNQIAQAKKDRATLNKLADAIDSKRKEMKRIYLLPYSDFEAQAKELTNMVKKQADAIASQIKAYDDFRRQDT